MRAVLRLMGLLAIALGMGAFAHAADLNGAWKGTFEFQGNSVPLTLNLKVDGATVTGTVEGLPTSPAEIHDGKIDAETVSFWVNSDYQGTTYKLVFRGKVSADRVDFTFGTEDGSWGTELTAKRDGVAAAPLDVTGQWKGAFDLNGTSMTLTFDLKSSGTAVTGTIQGAGPTPTEIHDGKIDGDTLTFWVNVDYEGQTYAITYKGKVTPGQIDFTFGTADGAWGSSLTAKKV